jgi:hypothetical protein
MGQKFKHGGEYQVIRECHTRKKQQHCRDTTKGKTSFFSFWYKAGATNAHTCHKVLGKLAKKANINVTFIGTKNGAITSVAII